MMTKEELIRLQQQLTDPQFCYIRIGNKLLLHTEDKNDKEQFLKHLVGRPVRCSRLAAKRLLLKMSGAVIEEIKQS
jgi:hypothetical protein